MKLTGKYLCNYFIVVLISLDVGHISRIRLIPCHQIRMKTASFLTGADPGEVKRVNFHPPFSEPPSFFFFLIPQILIGSNTLLQKFTPHFKILDPRLPYPFNLHFQCLCNHKMLRISIADIFIIILSQLCPFLGKTVSIPDNHSY